MTAIDYWIDEAERLALERARASRRRVVSPGPIELPDVSRERRSGERAPRPTDKEKAF